MKKILKTLSKYSIEIIFVCLFVVLQVYFDLKLPEYTSDIVNVGIQQGGLEYAVPEKIRESEFNKILFLIPETDKNFILNHYILITYNDNKIYKLKTTSEENLEKINDILVMPIIINYMMDKETSIQNQDVNFEVLKKQFESNSSLMKQSAIECIKNEYKAIDVNIEKIQTNYIKEKGMTMILISFLALFVTVLTNFLVSKVASYFSYDLRNEIIKKIMSYSNKEFDEIGVSSLITRNTNDVVQVQSLIMMLLRIVIYAPILGIGAFTKVIDSSMSWVIGLAVLIIFIIVVVLFSAVIPKFSLVQKMIDKINLIGRELLNGLPVVKAFSNEKHEEKRFDDANKDLLKVSLFVNRTMNIMMPTMSFIMNGVSVLIIWVGASKIDAGSIQIGSLLAFITYTMQIIMAFLMISIVSIMIPRSFISIKRIGEILNKNSSIKELNKSKRFKTTDDIIEFKDVYFRYPDAEEDVLSNVNFKCKKGTTTAFIGSTGSGKSTLINLIPRFFDVTSGKIMVKGVNIKEVSLKSLRSVIGYVPQKGNLFSGTIESNIKFGNKKINDEELDEIAKVSQSYDFIDKITDKYKSEISQGGTNVSGGQRQRLSIARAIAIKPEIYIFDDSFSALDYQTEKRLRKALKKYTDNSTILVVAQRISTILDADQIVVLDQGKIVGIGTHKELYKNCGVYKEITLSQFGKEEIEDEQ